MSYEFRISRVLADLVGPKIRVLLAGFAPSNRCAYSSSSIFCDQRSEASGFFGESLSFFTLGLVGGFSGLDASGIRPLLGRTGLGPAGSWPWPITAPAGSRMIPFS